MKLIAAAALGVASALPMLAAAEGDLTCPIRPGRCIPLPEEGTFYDGRERVVEGVATLLPAEVTFCILARAETSQAYEIKHDASAGMTAIACACSRVPHPRPRRRWSLTRPGAPPTPPRSTARGLSSRNRGLRMVPGLG